MYLATPQRCPYFKGVLIPPVRTHPYYQGSSPTTSFIKPFIQQNIYSPHPSLPTTQRNSIPPQNSYQKRSQTLQVLINWKTIPSNSPPQGIQGSLQSINHNTQQTPNQNTTFTQQSTQMCNPSNLF